MILLIKQYRLDKNINLRELSFLTGISYTYLNILENNKGNPTIDKIERIGHALEICPIRLLGGCYGQYCTSKCYYYNDDYIRFPSDARKEIDDFMKYVEGKYLK